MQNLHLRFIVGYRYIRYLACSFSIKSLLIALLMLVAVLNAASVRAWTSYIADCGHGGLQQFAPDGDYLGACRNEITSVGLSFCGTFTSTQMSAAGGPFAACGTTSFQNYYLSDDSTYGSCIKSGEESECYPGEGVAGCILGGATKGYTYNPTTHTCTCKSTYTPVTLTSYRGTTALGYFVISPANQCTLTSAGCPSGTTLSHGACITASPDSKWPVLDKGSV
jgi:hypothetical protein